MAATTIYIKGIAMFYHKGDGLWKILFPFDECHTVKLITPNTGDGESLGVGAGARVRIKAINPTSKFDIDSSFGTFLDLTAANTHKDGVKLKDDAKPFVLLTIESAKVSLASHTRCRYQLFENEEAADLSAFKFVAYSGKAEIKSEKIQIEVNEQIVNEFENEVAIIFDNTCKTEDPANPISDLILLYDVIEDASNNGKEFTMDRHPEEKPGVIEITAEMLAVLEPSDHNPAPFFHGLPCNVFKASLSNSLE